MDPLLINVPERIITPRLAMRPPRAGDGAMVNEAVMESIEALQAWMPWSRPAPTVEQSELWCRKSQGEFVNRTALPLLMFLRGGDGDDGSTFVGSSGMHTIEWSVPRFEIGYWVRRRFAGQGYVTEAVHAIAGMAFESLGAERVEIRVDERNERSRRVAERAGFEFEGTIRRDSRGPDGALRDMRVYAKLRDVTR